MDQAVLDRATQDLAISGMHCAACVRRVELALLQVPGVTEASVNLATERARVKTAAGTKRQALEEAVRRAGYDVPVTGARAAPDREGEMAALAMLLTAPLLLPMVLMPFGVHVALPAPVQFALAAIVQFGLGARFYVAAWKALRTGVGTMDTLIVLGTSAAFGLSVWAWVAGHGRPLYFEASTAVIAFVRLGKWLERGARRRAGEAIEAMEQLRPERARVRRGGVDTDIAATALRQGDLLVIRPGERIAADAIVREGDGASDESLLTGESMPVPKQPGSAVVGGALNGEATLLAEVTAIGAESRLAAMVRLVRDAQSAKPPVQRLVDRVSAVFVPAVIGVALLTLVAWLIAGAPVETAAIDAVAVLVIACPCALGLATPAAIIAGTGAAARHGILIRDPASLERAAAIRTVVFDKTGTLTEGKPELVEMRTARGHEEEELLRLAAALQSGSEHPLARAVLARALVVMPAANVRAIPGRGVEGDVGEQHVLLGNAALMHERGVGEAAGRAAWTDLSAQAEALQRSGRTVSFLAIDGAPLGLLAFGDEAKANAAAAVARLTASGFHIAMLTGDNWGAADAIATAVGITDVRAEALPEDKLAAIAELRVSRGAVAMVGDGVNDAPALAASDLGIAVATGTDVAAAAAGITLMRDDPLLVPAALDIARRTYHRIWHGLFWAFAYNVVGIPLAALGLLSPVFAGAAMALSSVSVVGSALLLRRWKPAL